MKPHETKIWISADDEQIRFLKFIRNQLRNDKYRQWMRSDLKLAHQHRIKTVSDVIRKGGYFKHTSTHMILVNIRNEYNNFITKKYTKNPCSEIFMDDII